MECGKGNVNGIRVNFQSYLEVSKIA